MPSRLATLDDVVAGAGDQDGPLVPDVLVGLDPLGISTGHDEGVAEHADGLGEVHVLAARAEDVHAAGDHVEAVGAEARNQAAPVGHHRLDVGDAHLVEYAERNSS